MCGRYSLIADISELQERFDFDSSELTHTPRYNVVPTQMALTVTNGSGRRGSYMRWGLIPSWAKSPSVGSRMINARAETLAERPSFRTAFQRRRCLVLADGFYEWERKGSSRRPMRIVTASGEPFAFAGLWDAWRDPNGEVFRSCTTITIAANDLLSPIHDRMPVILPRKLESLWLDHDIQDPAALGDILTPYPTDAMEAYEVSSLVNSPANDGSEVVVPEGQVGPDGDGPAPRLPL